MPSEDSRSLSDKRKKWQIWKLVATDRVRPNPQRLNKSTFSKLKKGDNIAWFRPSAIFHHAIVSEDVTSPDEVDVIHYKKEKGLSFRIARDTLKFAEQKGDPYLIVYPEEVTQKNNANEVIKRAETRLGETKYKLTQNNCESFASFCKTGESYSYQVEWFKARIVVFIIINILRPSYLLTSIPEFAVICYALGALMTILAEICLVLIDIWRSNNKRKNGDYSHKVYDAMVRLRILEAVCSVSAGIGLGIGGGVLGALIGSYIHWIFAYIFCAYGYTVLGLIGTVIGYVIASFLAPSIGTIVKKIKPRRRFDDIAVEIEDVHAGDHIFVNASVLHQQCHAIVVDVSHTSEQICVIRNAFRKGVVREMLKFKKPVYKALYKEAKIYSPHTVIERAKSKIGEREYSYFNCKRFALWCKESEKKENENIESVYTDNTRAENMEPSNREVVEIETHTLN